MRKRIAIALFVVAMGQIVSISVSEEVYAAPHSSATTHWTLPIMMILVSTRLVKS